MQTNQTPLASTLKIISDENRLKIICLLFKTKQICVSDVASKCKLSIATTSHHLKVLEKIGLVEPKRFGKENCYQLQKTPFIKDFQKLLCKYEPDLFK